MTKKFYLTTPIYYVNDKPHLGHAYTTLAADVLTRYYRLKGEEVFFLTGTDEHGQKIAQAAKKAGKEPQKFCDGMAKEFKRAWQKLNISNNDFIRTTEQRHIKSVQEFLKKLKKTNKIYKDKYEGLYCTGCEKFITEKELVNGKCPVHQKEPEKISEENWFFKLTSFTDKIKDLIEKDKLKVEPVERKNEVLGLLKQGIDNFSISREKVKWGIPIPWDKSQIIYCWVDALINYWTAKKWWPPQLHIIGKDIFKFHCLYWPAMLLALDLELPQKIFIHGYFTVDGQKMSKALGNIIDPNDLIEKFGVDATRYLLLSQFPFGQDGDISIEKLTETYNSDLANGIGNLVNRVIKFGKTKTKKPEKIGNPLIENLQFYEALKEVQKRIARVNSFVDEKQPWKTKNPKKILEKAWQDIFEIAQDLEPVMPETAQKILKQKSGILFPRL